MAIYKHCDICGTCCDGEESPIVEGTNGFRLVRTDSYDRLISEDKTYDLCQSCKNKIMKFIESNGTSIDIE